MTEDAHAGTALGRDATRLVEQAAAVAMCLDFDGTLAPIVDDPEQARPLPGMVDLLGPLAARFAAVALLCGRRSHPAGRRPCALGRPIDRTARQHVPAGASPTCARSCPPPS